MNFIEKCLGILYPQTCCFCGKVSKEPVCKECKGEIAYIEEPICKKCGKPIRYEENEYCSDCEATKFHYEQGRSVWLHTGKVRWSIYQFKYYNRRIYGKFYATNCIQYLYYKISMVKLLNFLVQVLCKTTILRK